MPIDRRVRAESTAEEADDGNDGIRPVTATSVTSPPRQHRASSRCGLNWVGRVAPVGGRTPLNPAMLVCRGRLLVGRRCLTRRGDIKSPAPAKMITIITLPRPRRLTPWPLTDVALCSFDSDAAFFSAACFLAANEAALGATTCPLLQ